MNRRTLGKGLFAAMLGLVGIRQTPAVNASAYPRLDSRSWYSVTVGDRGDVYDGDGVKQDRIVAVDVSDGYAIRLKRDNGVWDVTEGGHVVREEVMLKMPVRYVPL